jgi:hypothetical protein
MTSVARESRREGLMPPTLATVQQAVVHAFGTAFALTPLGPA